MPSVELPHCTHKEKAKTASSALCLLFCASIAIQAFFYSPSSHAQQLAQLDPNFELILDVRLDDQALGLNILGYQHEERFFISLAEFSDALRFPIQVDIASGQAQGWFIQPERTFFLDTQQQQAMIAGQTVAFSSEQVAITEEGIFIASDLLDSWFPVRITPHIRQLGLHIEALEQLPIQTQQQRAQRGAFVGIDKNQIRQPLTPDPYRFVGHRVNELRLTHATTQQHRESDVRRQSNYSLLSRGDLAWMTSTLSLSGREDKVTSARLNLERTRLNGPLGLQHFELGDINSQSGGRGAGSRGVLFRGGSLGEQIERNFSSDTVNINGDILPGWDVELHRNGVLIASQTVDESGRYQFENINLVFGENTFKLFFYGPFGEVKEEERRFFSSEDNIASGHVRYELSASQTGRSVFGINDVYSEDRDAVAYSANLDLGVTRHLSLNLGSQNYQRNGVRLLDYNFGAQIRLPFAQTRFNYRYQDDSYNIYQASLLTRIAGTGLSLNYSSYDYGDFSAQGLPINRQRWSSSLGIDRMVGQVPININAQHTEFAQSSLTNANLDTQFNFSNYRISKSFFYEHLEQQQPIFERTERLGGSLASTFNPSPWQIRLGLAYDIKPELELTQLNASSRLRIDNRMTMTFDVQHRLIDRNTLYMAGFNWRLDKFILSPRISYDSEGRYFGLLTISTNLATRPGSQPLEFNSLAMSDHGGVYGRVFVDQLGNGHINQMSPIELAQLNALQAHRNAMTNAQGEAYLSRLPAWRPTDVELDRSSLTHPEHIPMRTGYAVTPRPGHWQQLDFPHYIGTEIEGKVWLEKANGLREPIPRLMVTLFTEQGQEITRQRTNNDGSFVLTDVVAGHYQVMLQEGFNERVISKQSILVVPGDGETIYLADIIIAERGKESVNRIVNAIVQPTPHVEVTPDPVVSPAVTPVTPVAVGSQAVAQQGWTLQLGAFSKQANAEQLWHQLSIKVKTIVPTAQPLYLQSGGYTRLLLQFGAHEKELSEQEADKLCLKLQAQNMSCLLRKLP